MRKRTGIGMAALGFWLAGAVLAYHSGSPDSIQAAKSSQEIQQEIDEKNKQQRSVKEEKEQLEREISQMEEEKKDTLSYLERLDDKQRELSERMQGNQDSIQSARKEVKQLRKEKKKAGEEKKKQYDTMKKRIKYMYENGSEGYLELLMGSHSLSELFNRAEYVTKVSRYDRDLLKNYQLLQKKIQKAENKIQKNLEELRERRESLKVEKSSMNTLMAKKEQEVRQYQNLITDKNNTLGDTEALLASQENELEKLMAAQRAAAEQEEAREKAAREKAAREKANSNDKDQKQDQKDTGSSGDKNTTGAEKPSASGYCWPLTVSGRISSSFGYRNSPTAGASSYHKGIDIAVPVGTSVLAAAGGKVVTATYSSSAGNYVAISHGGGIYTYYMHCSSLQVRQGQQVSRGQRIALSGNSGISTGPHLHFAVFAGGNYVNPLNYVSH